MRNILCIIWILGCFPVMCQNLDKQSVLEDFNFLRNNIEKYNPALSTNSPDFKMLSEEVVKRIKDDSVSIFDYFKGVTRICALAKEGHLSLGSWNDTIHKGITKNKIAYLPIKVKLYHDKIIVHKDYSNERLLTEGDVITAINGEESDIILEKLVELIPSDGNIRTYAIRKIEEGFSWLYLLYIDQLDAFQIEYLDENNIKRIITIKALTRSEQVTNYHEYFREENQIDKIKNMGFYSLVYDSTYAKLTIPSFDYNRVNKFGIKSKKLYKDIFTQLYDKQINNLIIDLRNNSGGRNEFADHMVPFLMKELRNNRFLKKTISWEGKERIYRLPKKSKVSFRGRIYALVNGKTFSSASSLARFLKEYGNAIVIGSETGTRYEGFAAGSKKYIRLPNSQIQIGIPRYHILYPKSIKQETKDRGVIPDYEILYDFEDDINGPDLHLEKAINLINSHK